MNSQQLEQYLVSQNPHWTHPDCWNFTLTHTRDVFLPIWDHFIKNRLILAISGPRRIGKSYLLRQLIAHAIQTKTAAPENILTVAFTTGMNEPDIINQIVGTYRQNFSQKNARGTYVLLDEVQFLSLWPDQIKSIYDMELPIKFVVTGSTSLFYRQKSKESLLGRMLKFPLGVLSFGEYLRFKHGQTLSKTKAAFLEALPFLRRAFRRYLFSGQLPELVIDETIAPGEYMAAVADQLINFDIPYFWARLDRTLFSNLVKTVSAELANEVSANKLATGLGSSRGLISQYLQILEETGYMALCTNGYFKKMRAKVSGTKKIYSLNTNLSLAVNGFDERYFNDARVLGHYAENYAYLRLRAIVGGTIEYYRDRTGEIDFVDRENAWEVKFGAVGDTSKYEQLAAHLEKKLIILTENEMGTTGTLTKLPLYLL